MFLFVLCYAYLGTTIPLGMAGISPESVILNVMLHILNTVVVVAIFGLLVLMLVRLYKSDCSYSAKIFWFLVILLTNFVGATAFFIYDTFRFRRLSAE